jgi:regulator of replication initiation timing
MKAREAKTTANSKRRAKQFARQDAEIADLKAQRAAALQRIDKLEQENARLRDENMQLKQQLAAARKDSSTSSKTPSSDIVNPKKPRGKGRKKRKRGGQPGHPRHERPEFPLDMLDETLPYTLDSCPDCGGDLLFSRKADPRVVQQVELIAKPLWITGHRTDKQPGRTSDPLRRDRPPDHARHAQRNRPPLVRADLDHHRHMHTATSIGLRILVANGGISSSRYSPAFAHAVRPLTASLRSAVYASLR